MSLAMANTPRHTGRLTELADCHEDTKEYCGYVSSLLLSHFPAPELQAGGQVVSLRLGADSTLATSWRTSAEADALRLYWQCCS